MSAWQTCPPRATLYGIVCLRTASHLGYKGLNAIDTRAEAEHVLGGEAKLAEERPVVPTEIGPGDVTGASLAHRAAEHRTPTRQRLPLEVGAQVIARLPAPGGKTLSFPQENDISILAIGRQ